MTCRLRSFIETWLDPAMWRLHLKGIPVRVSGHVLSEPRYLIEDGKEWELRRCVRCGAEDRGWRWIG